MDINGVCAAVKYVLSEHSLELGACPDSNAYMQASKVQKRDRGQQKLLTNNSHRYFPFDLI